jgi:serine/threonine protein kinase
MTELAGMMIGNYFLLECMAREGMVETYRARPTIRGGCDVVLRLFRPGLRAASAFRDHFAEEVEKVWRCQHPRLHPLLEFGTGHELLYCVTALPDVPSLAQVLEDEPRASFSVASVVKQALQLCDVLQYVHEQHIVHGNIQPSSIYVSADEEVWLTHFGMCCAYHAGEPLVAQIDGGNAHYMAPEVGLGMLCQASDIYALGVLCYRLLAGKPPYTGETVEEIVIKHASEPIPSLRQVRPDVSEALEQVLQTALAKLPEQRFPSASMFARALHAALNDDAPASRVLVPTQRIVVRSRRTACTWSRVAALLNAPVFE